LNFLNNITIKNSSAALSGLLIVLAIGVSATGLEGAVLDASTSL